MNQCNELCTKESTGTCKLCDALAGRDSFTQFWFGGGLVKWLLRPLTWVWSLPPAEKMSLCSLFVAACALWVSVDQASTTRNHNKLSVEPQLKISFNYNNEEGAGWTISNAGIGPAEIRRFEVFVDNKPIHSVPEFEKILHIPSEADPHFLIYSPGSIVRANVEKAPIIFWLKNPAFNSYVISQVHRVIIKVCYCSLYGDCWIRDNTQKQREPAKCEFQYPFRFSPFE